MIPSPTAEEPARFAVVTSNRLDRLVDHFADQMRRHPLPPLEHEIVVVQSQGMQRWLTLELARRRGLAANLTTPFPRPFCRHLLHQMEAARQPGSEPVPRQDRSDFSRDFLLWRFVELLGDLADAPEEAALAAPRAYLEADPDQRKLYQLASRLAGLFDEYQLYRGDLLSAWRRGADPDSAGGTGAAAWQAELWRRLLEGGAVAGEPGEAPLDEPLDEALRRLIESLGRRQSRPDGLPRRLAVIGVSSLPPIFIELMLTLGRFIPVTVYLVSPTYHYWGDLRSERETARLLRRLEHEGVASQHDQHWQAGHPLLASLGKQGRELFELLQRADASGDAWHELDFEPPEGEHALAILQRDVLHLTDRGQDDEHPPLPLSPDDRSLSVHVCHSPMREMQVLRHQLLRAFDELPGLRPSDVLVLVPDMERYGPYIQAVFDVAREDSSPYLPFSIADRGAGREQPPSDVILRLLELADARLTLRDVFDLLETAAVRRTFGLDSDDLPTLRRLCSEAGVRWGLSAEHRQRQFNLPADDANTWRAGLDRLLLGYAMGRSTDSAEGGDAQEDDLVLGISPAAGDTAGLADRLGRFAELVARLEARLGELRKRRSLGEWAALLPTLVDEFLLAGDEDEERGLQLIRELAHQLAGAARRLQLRRPLSLQVIREHLTAALRVDGFGSGFLKGQITFCALRPMRTIPFRVICLCGLEAGIFPRRDRRPGFDLMAQQPRLGDRSVRDDDRYLFLETLLAARDRLVITHVGRSQQDGSERQPSAVVSELLEQVDRSFRSIGGTAASRALTVEHPLQPWSAAYFEASAAKLFSYAEEDLLTALELRAQRRPEPVFLGTAPPSPDASAEVSELTLAELSRFWQSPCRWFCEKALGLRLDDAEDEEPDTEPMALAGLGGYGIRQWLASRRLRDRSEDRDPDRDQERAVLRARGELPPGALGDAAFDSVDRRVEAFLQHVPPHHPIGPAPLDLRLDDPATHGGWRLVGVLDQQTDEGLLHYRCAKLRPRDWLRAWIDHLVLCHRRENDIGDRAEAASLLVGEDLTVRLLPVRRPGSVLAELLAGREEGERRPLPSFPRASFRYAEQSRALADPRRRVQLTPEEAARLAFRGEDRPPGTPTGPSESEDVFIRLAFRGRDPLAEAEFAPLAEKLWRPIFEHARVERP